jgi:hypothetical protein
MSYMRDFSWRYFESTGEIDAYLLYKEHQTICSTCSTEDAEPQLLQPEGEAVAE